MRLRRQRRDRSIGGSDCPGSPALRRHNGGPRSRRDAHPTLGQGRDPALLHWKRAHAEVWKKVSPDVMRFRMDKADRLGLTYEEYTLEILERGIHLQVEDVERIAAIKAARKGRRRRRHA